MLKIKKNFWKIWWYLILSAVALVMVFPFIWLVSSAFKYERNIFVLPPQLLPWPATIENFIGVFGIQNSSHGCSIARTSHSLWWCLVAWYHQWQALHIPS